MAVASRLADGAAAALAGALARGPDAGQLRLRARVWRRPPQWRTVARLLAADWSCYEAPTDRVDLERLERLVQTFVRGVTLWEARLPGPDGPRWWPVGYTAWHPVAPGLATAACATPLVAATRGYFAPQPQRTGWVYLFNYSIAAPLRPTPASRRLLKHYARELVRQTAGERRIACCVSDAGGRVARRMGLTERGACGDHDRLWSD